MQILVGTASWTDKTLIASKRFYPKGCSTAEARLRYYSQIFQMVEVDSSYYAMPSEQNSRLWAERTPERFRMNVKAFRLFTGHQTPFVALPKDILEALGPSDKKNLYYKDTPPEIRDELWKRYMAALEPLRAAGKLGALMFQFPPWLTRTKEGVAMVEHVAERTQGYTTACEFRHRSWFDKHTDDTLELLRAHDLVNVIVDEPQGFHNSIPQVWEVTSPHLAILRLHGRNAETWNVKDSSAASDRFNYDYPEEELRTLADLVKVLAERVSEVDVVFNNNFEDQGVSVRPRPS